MDERNFDVFEDTAHPVDVSSELEGFVDSNTHDNTPPQRANTARPRRLFRDPSAQTQDSNTLPKSISLEEGGRRLLEFLEQQEKERQEKKAREAEEHQEKAAQENKTEAPGIEPDENDAPRAQPPPPPASEAEELDQRYTAFFNSMDEQGRERWIRFMQAINHATNGTVERQLSAGNTPYYNILKHTFFNTAAHQDHLQGKGLVIQSSNLAGGTLISPKGIYHVSGNQKDTKGQDFTIDHARDHAQKAFLLGLSSVKLNGSREQRRMYELAIEELNQHLPADQRLEVSNPLSSFRRPNIQMGRPYDYASFMTGPKMAPSPIPEESPASKSLSSNRVFDAMPPDSCKNAADLLVPHTDEDSEPSEDKTSNRSKQETRPFADDDILSSQPDWTVPKEQESLTTKSWLADESPDSNSSLLQEPPLAEANEDRPQWTSIGDSDEAFDYWDAQEEQENAPTKGGNRLTRLMRRVGKTLGFTNLKEVLDEGAIARADRAAFYELEDINNRQNPPDNTHEKDDGTTLFMNDEGSLIPAIPVEVINRQQADAPKDEFDNNDDQQERIERALAEPPHSLIGRPDLDARNFPLILGQVFENSAVVYTDQDQRQSEVVLKRVVRSDPDNPRYSMLFDAVVEHDDGRLSLVDFEDIQLPTTDLPQNIGIRVRIDPK